VTAGHAFYDALTRPTCVALVGASDTAGKATSRPLAYLTQHGWPGTVFPVNPRRETVAGFRSWPALTGLPQRPDHVFAMTGADLVLDTIAECVELGVPLVTVLADGFVDTDPKGAERRHRLKSIIEGSATRLLGPSSLGTASLAQGLVLTANAAFADPQLQPGGVFVASQSGSAIGALASRGAEMGVGFHTLVSTGNQLDLSLGEICRAAVDDPQVGSFALFLENITGADSLRDFALAAARRAKPVIAYKLGRSAEAARLAVSHTGALAGDDAVADALLDDLGFARVTVFEALLEGQQFARDAGWRSGGPTRPRICVLSTTGGGGAMVVDCLAERGGQPCGPSPETARRLAEIGVASAGEALIDLTLAGTRYEVMKGALDIVLSAPEFDAVVAVPGSSARFHPDLAVKPIIDCGGHAKPLAAFVVPAAPDALQLLRDSGVSAFRTPEACADAVVAVCSRRSPRRHITTHRQLSGPPVLLDEAASYELLGRHGIHSAPHSVANPDDLPDALPVPGPVAVKLLSDEVAHKSDLGAVVLGVADAAGLAAAVATIRNNVAVSAPHLPVDRILVQSMVGALGEALVGLRLDPDAGPVVVVAAGGVLAELHRDRAVRIAPVDLATAREMVGSIVAFRPLAGYRGGELGDLEALAHAVVAISKLASTPDLAILEAEVNPLLIGKAGAGVCAVDALVRYLPDPRT